MIFNVLWSDKTFGGAEIYVRKMRAEFDIPFISLKDKSVWQMMAFIFKLLNPRHQFIYHDTRASLLSLIRFFYFQDLCVLHGPGKHARAIYFLHRLFALYCKKVILVNKDIFKAQSSQTFLVIENESSLTGKALLDKANAIYFGRLEQSKGVDKLCHAWEQSGKDNLLHIVGDGSLRAQLEKKHKQNIVYHGIKTHSELNQLIEDCSFYISCSEREGKSLALMEAMSTGLIPIVCDIESQHFLTEKLNLPLIDIDKQNSELIISQWLSEELTVRKATSERIIAYSKQNFQGNWSQQWRLLLKHLD